MHYYPCHWNPQAEDGRAEEHPPGRQADGTSSTVRAGPAAWHTAAHPGGSPPPPPTLWLYLQIPLQQDAAEIRGGRDREETAGVYKESSSKV